MLDARNCDHVFQLARPIMKFGEYGLIGCYIRHDIATLKTRLEEHASYHFYIIRIILPTTQCRSTTIVREESRKPSRRVTCSNRGLTRRACCRLAVCIASSKQCVGRTRDAAFFHWNNCNNTSSFILRVKLASKTQHFELMLVSSRVSCKE